MTWQPLGNDPQPPAPDPGRKPVVVAWSVVAGLVALLLAAGASAHGSARKFDARPLVPPPVIAPTPIPTVTVTASPQRIYVTLPPAPPPAPPPGPTTQDLENRANCYTSLSSTAAFPPDGRWVYPCQTAFPAEDPNAFVSRELVFYQRMATYSADQIQGFSPKDVMNFGWIACAIAVRHPGSDRTELATTTASGSTLYFWVAVYAASFDAICPEAENLAVPGTKSYGTAA